MITVMIEHDQNDPGRAATHFRDALGMEPLERIDP